MLIIYVATYLVFRYSDFDFLTNLISPLGLLGAFLAGMMYAYGFSAALGVAILVVIADRGNVWMYGTIAGLGALCSDLLEFKLLRYSFATELRRFFNERWVLFIRRRLPRVLKRALFPFLGAFIISTPLPDEIGVAFLAASGNISEKDFALLCFILNTVGIFVVLYLGRLF